MDNLLNDLKQKKISAVCKYGVLTIAIDDKLYSFQPDEPDFWNTIKTKDALFDINFHDGRVSFYVAGKIDGDFFTIKAEAGQ